MSTPSSSAGDRWISSGVAASLLGVSSETIRRWVDRSELDGFSEPRSARRRYFISERAVSDRLTQRATDVTSSVDELRSLRERVARLEATTRALEQAEVARERDAYRAESAALKEALLRMNAAMEHMEQSASEQAAALREQREALSLLLTPHSPRG